MSDLEDRKAEFIIHIKDLLQQVENMKFSRDNFAKKLQLIQNVHKLNYDNLDFIFFEMGSEKFRECITKKPDENLLQAQKCYLELNNEKRLDPESKRIYREFCEFILHYKTVLAAKHLELEARKEVKSDLKLVIPLTAQAKNNEDNNVRRSSRLAKKTGHEKEEEIMDAEVQEEENVVLRRSARLAAAHREA
jgi:hypothetical protein